jgi:hypothetical protein
MVRSQAARWGMLASQRPRRQSASTAVKKCDSRDTISV